jgi:hypothetical protein
MTQPTFTAIRQCLAGFITARTGLAATAQQQARVTPPQAVILPATGTFITYSEDMTGSCDLSLRILVLVSQADSADGMDILDPYLATTGTQSLWAAVQADATLGGVVQYALVREVAGYGVMNHGGIDYLAASVICDIGI